MRTIAGLSADSQTLITELRKVAEGETVTYTHLSSVIERNVQKEARGCLYTAVKTLRRDDGIVFDTVRGFGIKRLTDSEISRTIGKRSIRKINRESSRTLKKLECTDSSNLGRSDSISLWTDTAILGAIHEASKPKRFTDIQPKIIDTSGSIKADEVLSLLSKKV